MAKGRNGIHIWPAANHKSGILGWCGQRGIGTLFDLKKNGWDFIKFLLQGIQFVAIQTKCFWGLDE